VLRLSVEADSEYRAQQIVEEYTKKIKEIEQTIAARLGG
jgi:hypothetical protein